VIAVGLAAVMGPCARSLHGQARLVVSPDGPVRSLAEALRRVDRGGVVVVRPGVYAERELVVDRPVTIRGEGWPVLDAARAGQIMTVTADSVTVRGLVFRGVPVSFRQDLAAVKVQEAADCVVAGNRFERNFFAVYLARAHRCRVEGNEIVGTGGDETANANGVHAWYSDHLLIRGNRVRGHRDGIYLEFVEDSRVEGNRSEGNRRYGLHFMYSSRSAYRHNLFRGNGAGVAVMYSRAVEMVGNRFEDTHGSAAFALLLKEISDSRVAGNVLLRNSVGLFMEGGGRNRVEGNRLAANGWAVRVMASSADNVFSRNDFLGNSFDVATNSHFGTSRFAGNYWDGYRGYDLDRDGTGDVPHHPVRLFALLVEENRPLLILMRSAFVEMLDAAERAIPILTPEALVDASPSMRPLT
jgi:nitrous oxidase accessory protein